jgi:hypothetical protein
MDMRVFPSAKHLASWAGVCPGDKQNGGKQFQARTRPGHPRLKALLCEVAQAIARTSDNYLAALYHRIARRRGKGRATLAVAHAVLVILYHLLRDQKPSTDLGATTSIGWILSGSSAATSSASNSSATPSPSHPLRRPDRGRGYFLGTLSSARRLIQSRFSMSL